MAADISAPLWYNKKLRVQVAGVGDVGMIVHVIETVLSLVLLIGVGWWIAGRPWCGKAGMMTPSN